MGGGASLVYGVWMSGAYILRQEALKINFGLVEPTTVFPAGGHLCFKISHISEQIAESLCGNAGLIETWEAELLKQGTVCFFF